MLESHDLTHLLFVNLVVFVISLPSFRTATESLGVAHIIVLGWICHPSSANRPTE